MLFRLFSNDFRSFSAMGDNEKKIGLFAQMQIKNLPLLRGKKKV